MLRIIGLFGLLSPVFGSFVFVATWVFRFAEFQNQSFFEILDKLWLGVIGTLFYGVWGLLLAVPVGLIPASICGLGFWFVIKKLSQENPSLIKRFLIGGFVSLFLTTSLYCVFYFFSNPEDFFYGWWFFAWPSTVAGAFCALFVTNKLYNKTFPEKVKNDT